MRAKDVLGIILLMKEMQRASGCHQHDYYAHDEFDGALRPSALLPTDTKRCACESGKKRNYRRKRHDLINSCT